MVEWDPPASYSTETSMGQRPDSVPAWVGPHAVGVWNATGASLSAEIELRNITDGTSTLERTYDLAADEAVRIVLHDPATYYVTVTATDTEEAKTFSVTPDLFDCNASTTHIALLDDGRIKASMRSKMAKCPDRGSDTPTGTS